MPLPVNNTERIVAQIYRLYVKACTDLVTSGVGVGVHDADKMFKWSDYPRLADHVRKRLVKLASDTTTVIGNGITYNWLFAEQENDALVKSLFGAKPPENITERYLQRNLEALRTFQTRKANGLGLSGRVWKYVEPLSSDMELVVDYALANGTPAVGRIGPSLAENVKQYLLAPNQIFNKVKNARGVYQLSAAAKNYHPGQGVYRSSYKNAARLARTEINAAYRESDYERWQDLDFVVGYEVRRSNHPYYCPMCEGLKGKYPKGFKFTGWHPQCRCNVVSILATEKEIERLTDMLLNEEDLSVFRSENEVTSLPNGYKEWITDNKPKLLSTKKPPYFIRDNYKDGEFAKGLRFGRPIQDVKPKKLDAALIDKLKTERNFKVLGDTAAYDSLLPGFDYEELDRGMSAVADSKNFTWTRKTAVGYAKDNEVHLTYEGNFKGEDVLLKRVFGQKPDGTKYVSHELFKLPKTLQGNGTSREVFKSLYAQYQNSGIERIDVHANIDVGGLAWARYGFTLNRPADFAFVERLAKRKLRGKELTDFVANLDAHRKSVNPIWSVSGTEAGKKVLLGSDWYGHLNLKDGAARKLFEDYLFKK